MDINPIYLVTTSQNAGADVREKAIVFSNEFNFQFISRNFSLKKMAAQYTLDPIFFIFTIDGMYVWYQQNAVHFHINMAKLRINHLMQKKHDRMIQAMALQKGERVLDCTMGMGTDAIVASHIVGVEGCVTALESEAAIYHLVNYGLANYELPGHPYLTESMRRIYTVYDEALDYLKQAADHAFHIVYFDPMFRVPVASSSGIAGIRELSNAQPLTPDHIEQAIRVSQRAVVMKERPGSAEFKRLGFSELPSTRGASVAYGVIYTSMGRG